MGKAVPTKSTEYAALVAEAEASVSAVKDTELRRVAFEKILATLLEREQSKSGGQKRVAPERGLSSAEKSEKRSGSTTRQGPKGHVETLIDDGFFRDQRTMADVKAELANRGYHIAVTSLSGPLQKLTQERRLRRQKVTGDGKGSKGGFAYSNW